jgi:hypothetical protein
VLAGVVAIASSVVGLARPQADMRQAAAGPAALAEAAREARYVLSAVASGDTRTRAAGAAYVQSSLAGLRRAADASGDETSVGLASALPADTVDHAEAAVALVDAIAARAERLATEAEIEENARARWGATSVARTVGALTGASVLALAVLVAAFAWVSARYRRDVRDAIPEEVEGRTDADRVAFLGGRLRRARRVADQGRLGRDELAASLVAATADRRAYQQFVSKLDELDENQLWPVATPAAPTTVGALENRP